MKDAYGLTDAQSKVLKFIASFTQENDYPPTRAEISRNFGWDSCNAADDVIKALKRKGRLAVTAGVNNTTRGR